jgi:hypothetical protein
MFLFFSLSLSLSLSLIIISMYLFSFFFYFKFSTNYSSRTGFVALRCFSCSPACSITTIITVFIDIAHLNNSAIATNKKKTATTNRRVAAEANN